MKRNTSVVKKVTGDFLLNIIANALPIVAIQLIILPYVSSTMGGDDYGNIVTYVAFMNVFPSAFGLVLNNIRLLFDGKYSDNNIQGDFHIILALYLFLNSLITIISIFILEHKLVLEDVLLILLISDLTLLREYYRVAFRIKLDFKNILVNNIFFCAGCFLGVSLFLFSGKWQYIYIIGTVSSLFYIIRKTDLWRESFETTFLFKEVTKESTLLLISALLGRVTTYADKLILYPLLGGTSVAIYYAATLFGKVVSLVVTPINGVALSYLAKFKKKSNRVFILTLGITTFFGLFGYVLCLFIYRPVLSVLYPQYVDAAMGYIKITTGAVVLQIIITTINPFLMKFFKMKWQVLLNGFIALFYVSLSFFLLGKWGLMGFCIGCLITNAIKIIIMLSIYFFSNSAYEETDSDEVAL